MKYSEFYFAIKSYAFIILLVLLAIFVLFFVFCFAYGWVCEKIKKIKNNKKR